MSLMPTVIPENSVLGAAPGSQTFTEDGSFTVPSYNSLIVEMWGGGRGGNGNTCGAGTVSGANGTESTFAALTAGGPSASSGGDINTPGVNGDVGSGSTGGDGGDAPNGGGTGGSGSTSNGSNGNIPAGGGGGGGKSLCGEDPDAGPESGGKSGGYVKKTYSPGDLTVDSSISVTVGQGGAGGVGNDKSGGNGARGEVRVSWT